MGINAWIFDDTSKECLNFDRLANLHGGNYEIYSQIVNFNHKVAGPVVLDYLKSIQEPRSPYWLDEIRKFVQDRPNGLFFVMNDAQEEALDLITKYNPSGIYTEIA